MSARHVGLVCAADSRLRGVCSVLLRHAGYRVIDVATAGEARPILEAENVSLFVSGVLADPDNELRPLATARDIPVLRLAPTLQIEELLKLFERLTP